MNIQNFFTSVKDVKIFKPTISRCHVRKITVEIYEKDVRALSALRFNMCYFKLSFMLLS